MPRVIITESDGSVTKIEYTGKWESHDAILQAHGYNATEVVYEIEDPQDELKSAIKNASNLTELKDALMGKPGGPTPQANKNNGW